MRFAAAALVLLLAGPASAQEEAPSKIVWGSIEALQDYTGGRFRDVRKSSREVEIVRQGVELEATPGMRIAAGDAVRAGRGRALIGLTGGGTVLVGERSQVRIDPDLGWTQRLGRLDISAVPFIRVLASDVVVEAEGADFRVERDIVGDGSVSVLRGTVTLRIGEVEKTLPAGTRTPFTQVALDTTMVLDPDVLDALIADRDVSPVEVTSGPSSTQARAHVRISGGVSHLHGADFGRVGLSGRIRLGGPMFLALGGAFAARPVDELDIDVAFVAPFHLGLRVVAPLPRAFLLYIGVDFTAAVGEWCAGIGCVAEPVFEPGVRGVIGGGLELTEHIGLDLSVAAGVLRRVIPLRFDPPEPVVPDLQIHFGVGVFFLF